jgi:superfamily II DNA or RNA helicase
MLTHLLSLLEFSEPVTINTKAGPKRAKKAPATSDFWDYYRPNKGELYESMKESGFQIGKYNDRWEITWWERDGKFVVNDKAAGTIEDSDTPLVLPELQDSSILFRYQIPSVRLNVRAMAEFNSCLIAEGTGMGKTFIALAVARERGRRIAVICPKAVVTDWHRSAAKMGIEIYEACGWEWIKTGKSLLGNWLPNPPHKNGKPDKERKNFGFTVPDDVDLIFDEAHRAKAMGTQNSLLLKSAVDQGISTMFLTATIADNPTRLWAIGQPLGLHTGGKDYYRFLFQNGCQKGRFGIQFTGNHKNLQAIRKRIFPSHGSRLRQSDIGDEFPDTIIRAKPFDMDTAQEIAGTYDQLMEEIENIRQQESAASAMGSILAEITRARQKVELLKAPSVCDLVDDLREEGNSIFIAVNYTATLEFILKTLKIDSCIRGGQSEMVRRGYIDAFHNDKNHVIVGIIQACREGLNLHDINGERPRHSLIMPTYSVFDMIQVLGRIWRAGGKSKSFQNIVYAAGVGIEEDICESLQGKLDNMNSLMDGDIDATVRIYETKPALS